MNIQPNLDAIRDELDAKCPHDLPEEVALKLERLATLEGLSAEMIAESNKKYNQKVGQLVLNSAYKNLTATDKKLLFASLASDEIYWMQLSEAYNKELHYQIEAARTLLSYLKQQQLNAKFL